MVGAHTGAVGAGAIGALGELHREILVHQFPLQRPSQFSSVW